MVEGHSSQSSVRMGPNYRTSGVAEAFLHANVAYNASRALLQGCNTLLNAL